MWRRGAKRRHVGGKLAHMHMNDFCVQSNQGHVKATCESLPGKDTTDVFRQPLPFPFPVGAHTGRDGGGHVDAQSQGQAP